MIEPINKNRAEATDWQFKQEMIDKINEIITTINAISAHLFKDNEDDGGNEGDGGNKNNDHGDGGNS